MTTSVVRDRTQPMRHIVHIRNHQIPVDGTREEGGLDSGPSAHDLYDAALGACKALTLVWYARRKSIPIDDLRVRVERDASAERQGVYRLAVYVTLTGELTDAQRRELLSVAERCPVHKLMTAVKTEITTAFE
jgi:putative redox protein